MRRSGSEHITDILGRVLGFGIPFLLVVYLAMDSGGYELIPRSQLGILAWWAVLLGVLAGVLPFVRVTPAAWGLLGILGAVLLWTVTGLLWTESTEHTVTEMSRVSILLGILVLLVLTGTRESLRNAVAAVAAAVTLVSVIALTDRLLPDLLPFGSDYVFPAGYPRARLNYPLEYWNGLAAFIAVGVGPMLWVATSAARVWVRSLAVAALPVLALTGYLTASRGGVIEGTIVILAFFCLFPRRIRLLLTLALPALGSALLIVLINGRSAVRDLEPANLISDQGSEMTWLVLVVVLLVGLGHWTLTSLADRGGLRLPRPQRGTTAVAGLAVIAVAVVAIVGLFASGFAGDRWEDFKQPSSSGTVDRLSNLNSGERYLIWKSSFEASKSEPLTGIGPGAFEFWWARDGQGSQFVRDSHSIYLENLAELGPIGFLLIIALVLGPIALAARLSLREGDELIRSLAAAAAAGMVAFAIAAGIDWAWEMTVLPVMFLILAAAVAGNWEPDSDRKNPATSWGVRIPVALASAGLIVLIAIPLTATMRFNESQEAVRANNLGLALSKAEDAVSLQPYSTTARIQEAQVLDLIGRDEEAVEQARKATEIEPLNWTNWLVLSQIVAERSPAEATRAFARARSLNPKSPLFGTS